MTERFITIMVDGKEEPVGFGIVKKVKKLELSKATVVELTKPVSSTKFLKGQRFYLGKDGAKFY